MKKIIIFGATGNVGSYFTKYCKEYFDEKSYCIVASGRKETNIFTKEGIEYCKVDITKEEDFNKLPKEDVYAVVLLAAKIPSYMDNYDAKEYIYSNIIGAYNVLEYCRKVKADRILYTQTVFDVSLSCKDGIELKPDIDRNFSYVGDHAMYVISKNTALEFIEHYYQEYGLKKFIFRLPTIYNYSPYQYYYPNGEKKMRPVYQMINRAIKGEPIELWGDPNYAKDMVHVYDFSQMLCKAIEVDRNEGFYNIGTGKPVTLKEQLETIIDVFSPANKKSEIIYRPEKKSGGGFLMDVSNAKEELGYEPLYDCKKLFEDYKKEMNLNRFDELRKK
ncbi:NAD-dependent epimerase/dehydratase family protein [Clostridium perfringens]|uniref:NAD-dependent epimerase/dehydratase family protein n=1 Tax=Clostridium perfringens TaxID=1502 RepID=UPI002A26E627|nr:NAD(P)-dependent oxidoreductase [Clostridium perfringens]